MAAEKSQQACDTLVSSDFCSMKMRSLSFNDHHLCRVPRVICRYVQWSPTDSYMVQELPAVNLSGNAHSCLCSNFCTFLSCRLMNTTWGEVKTSHASVQQEVAWQSHTVRRPACRDHSRGWQEQILYRDGRAKT